MAQRDESHRRKGDMRDFIYTGPLAWWPIKGHPFRWKPNQGDPECVGEYVSQSMWTHRLILYVALVVTLILIVMLFDIRLVVRN